MKFPLGWLKDHLETTAALSEITDRLTALGLEVESVQDRTAALGDLVVGEILTAEPHPDADRLRVCSVEAGNGPVQVVCGAPNARAGLKSIFAAPGSVIPAGGVKLKTGVIRGVESRGMLCSAREIGLGEEHDGILELSMDAAPGAPAAEALAEWAEPVIEIALTPNRADCAGLRGIARDLAAAGLGVLKPLPAPGIAGGFPCPVAVRLDFPDDAANACPEFQARLIRGVKNGPSPDWLRERLTAAGLRPISTLVDITNYFTLDRARPLHVFDAAKLTGDLTVRPARDGETLAALDGNTYELASGMTVIADDRGVLSLGGVIGGESSGCTEQTTDVLIECASFSPVRTAATGRALRIDSDARYRFERGVDPAGVRDGIEAATAMILELCGGEAGEIHRAGQTPDWRREISFRPSRVHCLGGVDLPAGDSQRILESLGFEIADDQTAGDGLLTVTPPSWRGDVQGEADLVEEVLRVHGYDSIPTVAMDNGGRLPRPARDPAQRRPGRIARALAARGLAETVNWSFMDAEQSRLFGGGDDALRLLNPISQDLGQLRPTPLALLITAAVRNLARGQADFGLFEIGPAFTGGQPSRQQRIAAGLRIGQSAGRHWSGPARAVDAFDSKADALAALAAVDAPVANLRTAADAPAWYHPGRSGRLMLGPKTVLAQFGELHPAVAQALDLNTPAAGFEIFLDALPKPKAKPSKARPALDAPPYQPVARDFAFLVDEAVPAADLAAAARNADKALVDAVDIFDVYAGKGVPAGRKSVALSVTLQPRQGTLTDAEIEAAAGKIAAAVTAATGGDLRGI